MLPAGYRLGLALALAILHLSDGNRLSASSWTDHGHGQQSESDCCSHPPAPDSLPSLCSCQPHPQAFFTDTTSSHSMSDATSNASASGLQPLTSARKLHVRSRSSLRVSHNTHTHDLVALSHSSAYAGVSRLKANAHLQRLGGATPNPLERTLVVAQYREDLSWLSQVNYLPSIIYQADNASAHNRVIRNMGETAVYLQYIVEHYDVLPRHMAFVHGHRSAKHMPDVVPLLQNLQWGRHGFANLRYVNITLDQWGKWTGDWLHPSWPEKAPDREEIIWDDLRVSMSRNYAQMWALLFEQELGHMPEFVHAPCCAEFVVSAERVRRHSKQFYASLLDWLRHTSNDRFWAGRIFEYVWHIVFGEDAVYYAPAKCELLHCAG